MDPLVELHRREVLATTLTGVAGVIAGCAEDLDTGSGDTSDEPQGETVVRMGGESRKTAQFEAEAGDEIEITITDVEGARTHVAVNRGLTSVFSEGVLDEETFRITLEETGTYDVTLTPTDDSPGTSGSVEITLYENPGGDTERDDAKTEQQTTASGPEPVAEWVTERLDDVRAAQESYANAVEAYENEGYDGAQDQFAEAETRFDELTDDATRKAADAPDGSDLADRYYDLVFYLQEMRTAARYYKYAARVEGDPTSDTLTGRNPEKSGDASYWQREAREAHGKAEESRENVNSSLSNTDL